MHVDDGELAVGDDSVEDDGQLVAAGIGQPLMLAGLADVGRQGNVWWCHDDPPITVDCLRQLIAAAAGTGFHRGHEAVRTARSRKFLPAPHYRSLPHHRAYRENAGALPPALRLQPAVRCRTITRAATLYTIRR